MWRTHNVLFFPYSTYYPPLCKLLFCLGGTATVSCKAVKSDIFDPVLPVLLPFSQQSCQTVASRSVPQSVPRFRSRYIQYIPKMGDFLADARENCLYILYHGCPTVENMIVYNYMNSKHLKVKSAFIDLN